MDTRTEYKQRRGLRLEETKYTPHMGIPTEYKQRRGLRLEGILYIPTMVILTAYRLPHGLKLNKQWREKQHEYRDNS